MSSRRTEEGRPVAREIDRLAETVGAKESELDRLEAELDDLERRLGAKALEAAAAEPHEEPAMAGAPAPVAPAEPVAPVVEATPAPVAAPPPRTVEVRDPRIDSLAANVEALGANLQHLRALAANADRKIEGLAVASLQDDPVGDGPLRLQRSRALVVAACVAALALLWWLVELA